MGTAAARVQHHGQVTGRTPSRGFRKLGTHTQEEASWPHSTLLFLDPTHTPLSRLFFYGEEGARAGFAGNILTFHLPSPPEPW